MSETKQIVDSLLKEYFGDLHKETQKRSAIVLRAVGRRGGSGRASRHYAASDTRRVRVADNESAISTRSVRVAAVRLDPDAHAIGVAHHRGEVQDRS